MAKNLMDWRTIANDREKYHAYLCSPEWGCLRDAVRQRSGGKCERCRRRPMDACHHLTYIRKYQEELEDLQAICKPCHEFTHGHSNVDPLLSDPAVLFGREIHKVYLCGKMTSWRDELTKDWRSMGIYDTGCDIQTPWGHYLFCTGPHFIDTSGGHGDGYGAHKSESLITNGLHHDGYLYGVVREDCVRLRAKEIQEADLLFAWIDDLSAYGSFSEIGFACALNKPLVVAFANEQLADEAWFPGAMGLAIIAPNVRSAWDRIWGKSCADVLKVSNVVVRDRESTSIQ